MTRRLSVNLNKIALLRNSRTTGVPDMLRFCDLSQQSGAIGVTIHPRPDQRHIRDNDVEAIASHIAPWRPHFELNIEGFPDQRLLAIISRVEPDQVTLVPDAPDVLTSETGWQFDDREKRLLDWFLSAARASGRRFSLFLDPPEDKVSDAAALGADRIELYTGKFAADFRSGEYSASLAACARTAARARSYGMGVNAGHDLNGENLVPLLAAAPQIDEVSIGHELISDALIDGFSGTVARYVQLVSAAPER